MKLGIELKDVIKFNNLIETCYDFPFGKFISKQDCAHYSFRRNDYTVVAAPPTKTHKCKQNYFIRHRNYANYIENQSSLDITREQKIIKPAIKHEFFAVFSIMPSVIPFSGGGGRKTEIFGP